MIIIIIVVVILSIFLIKYLKKRFNGLQGHNILINGGSGTGKTATLVYFSLILYYRNFISWAFKRYFLYYLFLIFPCFFINFLFLSPKVRLKYSEYVAFLKYRFCSPKPILIGNFPILIFKFFRFSIYSFSLDPNMLICGFRFPEDSVIYLSEAQNYFDQYFYKDETRARLLTLWLSQHRHFDNSFLLVDSQSLDNLYNGFTRTSSQIITTLGYRKFILSFITVFNYNNVYNPNLVLDPKIRFLLFNPFKHFNSRFNYHLIDKYSSDFVLQRFTEMSV